MISIQNYHGNIIYSNHGNGTQPNKSKVFSFMSYFPYVLLDTDHKWKKIIRFCLLKYLNTWFDCIYCPIKLLFSVIPLSILQEQKISNSLAPPWQKNLFSALSRAHQIYISYVGNLHTKSILPFVRVNIFKSLCQRDVLPSMKWSFLHLWVYRWIHWYVYDTT